MNIVAVRLQNRLTFLNKVHMSRMLQHSSAHAIKSRVMSTPTWPVPYYQRMVRAYPVREKKDYDLCKADTPFSDENWIRAKQALSLFLHGRQVIEHTQNHVKTNTYAIKKEDCQTMAKAYVDDISQFLDLAHRENLKILGGKTLI